MAPCGQCLHCRINKRDFWTARAVLESLSSSSAQFWTLTLSPEGLNTFHQLGARQLVRRFVQSLRVSEKRAGNGMTPRFFGALEYGDTTFREHIHLIVYNLQVNLISSTPYQNGLPRPRIHSAHWPHGHVDIQPFSVASARYVAKYVTKFEETQDEALAFHPKRPPLGYNGLAMLVDHISRSPARKWPMSPRISLDGKQFSLDPRTEMQYSRLLRAAGISCQGFTVKDRQNDKAARNHLWDLTTQAEVESQLRKEQTRDLLYANAARRKELRLFSAFRNSLNVEAVKA